MARVATGRHSGKAETGVAEARRHDLLEAAYALVAEHGLEGLRTRDVAARAGVNVATLHYYFGSKERLLVALVAHTREKFSGGPGGRSGREALSGPRTLRAHLERAWATFRSTPHLATVMQELALRAGRDAATRAAFRALHDGWNAMVEASLAQERRRGALSSGLDVRATARVVTSFVMGAVVQLGVNPRAFDFETAARTLESLVMGQEQGRPR